MTRAQTILLPFALLFAACDSDPADEEGEEAAAVEERAGELEGERHGKKRRWEMLDTDKDGFVSLAEAEGHKLAKHFTEIDTDADGKLSKDELAAKKHHKGKRGGGHGKDPAERAAKMMAKLDADGDGAISLAEAQGHRLAEKFALADADGDGKLTKDELTAFKAAHHRREATPGANHG